MKKINFFILVIFAFVSINLLFANPISESDALKKAKKFYDQYQSVSSGKSSVRTIADLQLVYTCADSVSPKKVLTNKSNVTTSVQNTYFYIFNNANQKGFIIVSADDATKAILGYSDEGNFSVEKMPENLQGWLDFYKSEIKYAIQSGLTVSTSNLLTSETTTIVSPLLGTIKWDQSEPYNLQCPTGTGGQVVTGCVATAMAQIMKYYQWPVKGTGSHSYTHPTYGLLSANFGTTTYDWANMLNTYSASATTVQKSAVATLMYNCGVAVDMNYDLGANGGSGASTTTAGKSLVSYFGYDSDLQSFDRSYYSYTDWKNLVKSELDAARPVLYTGYNSTAGHAFICDGYDSNNLFHINWGWSGSSNGYFELSALNPSTTGIGGSIGGFSQSQSILAGIQKPDGINNPINIIGLYTNGLSSSLTSISNISTITFTTSFGFLNRGLSSYSGLVGVGLYLNGVFQKVLKQTSFNLQSNYGYTTYSFSSISLAGLAAGTYQICAIYQPTGKTDWTMVKKTNTMNNSLDVVITGTTAVIKTPINGPSLALTKALLPTSKLYQNKKVNFNFSIKNSGTEFYSNLGVYLYSADKSVKQYVCEGAVCIPAGETMTFDMADSVKVNPGTYYAAVVCDSTNSESTTSYKVLGLPAYNPVSVTVLNQPIDAVLVTSSTSLTKTTIARYEPNTITTTINNTGGYFDSNIIAFYFPSAGGSSLGYFGPITTYLETNVQKTVSFNGSLDLAAGQYFFKLYYLKNNTWTSMSSTFLFTVVNPTLSVTSSNLSLLKTAGNTSITVSSNTTWTALSNQNWLSVSPNNATTGNSTLTFTATANTGAERIAIVSISANGATNQTVTITQAANFTDDMSISSTSDIILFPNPTEDILNIQISENVKQIKVTDLSGRLLLKAPNTKSISTNNLSPGIYLLQVETENGKLSKRFVKK